MLTEPMSFRERPGANEENIQSLVFDTDTKRRYVEDG